MVILADQYNNPIAAYSSSLVLLIAISINLLIGVLVMTLLLITSLTKKSNNHIEGDHND